MIPLHLIDADIFQPRKNFNPERLSELMASIKQHGVLNPVTVEKAKGGRYLLVNGERRFRASKELKLPSLPAVVMDAQDATKRLIQQFHIQELHQGWTALEKAMAVSRLASEMKVSVLELAAMLSLPEKTVHDYVAFSKLIERGAFERNETPLHFAPAIVNLNEFVKKTYVSKLKKEFTADRSRALEKALISRIKERSITKPKDIVKLRDAVKVNPKIIESFIDNDKMTTDKAFLDSEGQVSSHYRNIINNANAMATHIRSGLSLGVESMFESDSVARAALKAAEEQLKSLINKI